MKKWTDKDIDKLYTDSAERLSFEYKQSYWEEFENSLPQDGNADTPSLSDADIDALYASSAAGLSFDYKKEYWDEFEQTMADAAPKSSLTDAEIDAMYAASASALSFDYNNDYWSEFEKSIGSTPKPSLTDAEIDALYAANAAAISIAYNQKYWDEFEKTMLDPTPAMTDSEIDAMYAASAAGLSFEYNRQYWNDFNDAFATDGGYQGADEAVLADTEIDNLYQESANDLSFEYQHSYWEEFTALWKRKRRPDFLWFATAYTFVGALGLMLFMGNLTLGDVSPSFAQFGNESDQEGSVGLAELVDRARGNTVSEETRSTSNTQNKTNQGNLDSDNTKGTYYAGENSAPSANPSSTGAGSSPITGLTPTTTGGGTRGTVMEPMTPREPVMTFGGIDLASGGSPLTIGGEDREPGTPEGLEIPGVIKPKTPAVETDLAIAGPKDDFNMLSYRDLALSNELLSIRRPGGGPINASYTRWYAQGLGGLSQSMVTPSDKISNSFGLGVGLEWNKRNFTLEFGLNGVVENYNDLVLTKTSKVYDFGSVTHRLVMNYDQLYTLEGSIGFGYNLNRHRFMIGVRPSIVVSSRMQINEYTRQYGNKNGEVEVVEVARGNYYGEMSGVNQFGVKPTIGYAFRVTPIWTIGGSVGMEFMPSINEEFINGVNNRLPLDGQIYIRRTFSFTR